MTDKPIALEQKNTVPTRKVFAIVTKVIGRTENTVLPEACLFLARSFFPLLQESQAFGLIQIDQQFGIDWHRLECRTQLLVQFGRGSGANDIAAQCK